MTKCNNVYCVAYKKSNIRCCVFAHDGSTQDCKSMRKYNRDLKAGQSLLQKVLAWRGLDGDGISDPLRNEIKKEVENGK